MTTTVPPTTFVTPSTEDQQAVAALTQRVVAAWATHDVDGFADVFTEDGTLILPGVFKNGREEIRTFLKKAFDNQYKGTRVTGRPIGLRFPDPDVAILLTHGGVLSPGETEVSDEQSIRASWVAVKRDGQWWLSAYQNSPVNWRLPIPRPGGS